MQRGLMIRLISILTLLLYPQTIAVAQTTISGELTGVVTDPSGAVVPGIHVRLRSNSKGTTQSTTTDQEGTYQFSFLLPGSYTLTVSHLGFRETNQEVNVSVGPPGTRNVPLEIADANSTVKVTDEMPLLQAENGDAATTVNQKQVSEVPNPGNDLTYIAQSAPGAIMNTDTIGGNFAGIVSILGMPGTSNLFTINGMNENFVPINTNSAGALGMLLGQNEIQEATVVSNGYSAQLGGAAGSNINYVTKSGGNAFHGNAAWYWNGRILNANDWIDNAEGNPRPFDIANQWAASIGGPILKDRLFFFFDTEGMHLVLPQPTYVVLPTAAFESATMANIDSVFGPLSASHKFYQQAFDLYNQTPGASKAIPGSFVDRLGCNGWTNPNDQNNPNRLGASMPCAVHFFEDLYHRSSESIESGRVDWNMGANNRLFFLAQYDHSQRALYIDPINSAFNAFMKEPWWQGQLNETHIISPTASNQFLLAGTYMSFLDTVLNPAQPALFPTELNWCNAGCPFSNLGNSDVYNAMPSGTKTISFQISDDFVKAMRRQKLGLGISFLRTYTKVFGYAFAGTGEILPQTINAFFYGGTSPASPAQDFTSFYQTYPAVTWNRIDFYSLGLYGQDEWHALANLTITVGMRATHQSNPVCATRCFSRLANSFDSLSHDPKQPYNQAVLVNQRQAFAQTDNIVWSPRLSFAWQPLGVSHNTVLRGGIGIFYDLLPGAIAANQSTNFPMVNAYTVTGYNLAPMEANSLSQVAAASNAALVQGFASGATLAQLQALNPRFTPPAVFNPPHTLHPAQYQKWSLQAQQTFGGSNSLTISYFGNHGIHELFQDVNTNGHSFATYPSVPCGSPPVAPCYDTRFGQVQQIGTSAISNYNGMVVSFAKRVSGQGQLQVNYTYGHALDEVSNGGLGQFNSGSNVFPQDGRNLRGSYGAADYDARHSLNANYIWEVPFKEALRRHGPEALEKGWQLSGTVMARSGFPYTAIDYGETGNLINDNIFGPIYSVPVGPIGPQNSCGQGAAIPAAPATCLPPQMQSNGSPNPGALFVQTGCETGFNMGNLPGPNGPCSGPSVALAQGRNRFRGPGYVTTDLAIMKSTNIHHWENGVFIVGLQFFNLFNHPNFGIPDNATSDGGFGRIFYQGQSPTSVLGSGLGANVSGRTIQVKAQLRF
jgi:hypothetical protein